MDRNNEVKLSGECKMSLPIKFSYPQMNWSINVLKSL